MGKSLRNKAQTKSRRLKRSESWYGQHDTDRIQRLSDRLLKRKVEQDGPEGVKPEEVKKNEDGDEIVIEDEAIKVEDEDMDATTTPKKISTSGDRMSRREEWRVSKGMPIRGERKGKNRQGGEKARRRSGRPARRR
ncbi:hypothetical protein HD553DRAFT_307391 [Filobasidium floriforme]|uniref:uncharacterized protein n=1 Tax=Filobasidium floriforme TaxID=5210 RepID=UPI001E8D1A44|nr:uncharacterized protein HD553DRAFT_307391 [Filobasidium floriforme]KAH8088112.1 hypothetical protein HD553DRAFT_307391 [Filobasidium floriforme]